MTHDPFDQYEVYPDQYHERVWGPWSLGIEEPNDPPSGELHTVRVHRTPGLVRPWVARCIDCSFLHVGWRSSCIEAADAHGTYTVVGEVA